MNSSKSDFTQGSILGKLLPFMLPILGALVLQAAYGAVDLLVVGRFGTTSGLSAVSTGSQVLNLVTFVITQFAGEEAGAHELELVAGLGVLQALFQLAALAHHNALGVQVVLVVAALGDGVHVGLGKASRYSKIKRYACL